MEGSVRQGRSTRDGGREYRGLRTRQYTYVRDLNGPWLLYDNLADPFQLTNLVADAAHGVVCRQLDAILQRRLDANRDEFLPGPEYIRRWGYEVDERDTIPFDDVLAWEPGTTDLLRHGKGGVFP